MSAEQKTKFTLEISKELQSLIPLLTAEEEKRLTDSLKAEGCREAIWFYRDDQANKNIIVDGHNRRRICKANGIQYRTKLLTIVHTLSEAKVWVIHNQLARRNLTIDQKAEMAAVLEELYKIAKKNQRREPGKDRGKDKNTAPKTISGISSRAQAAKDAGISESTLKRHKKVMDKGTPEQKTALKAGTASVSKLADEVDGKSTVTLSFKMQSVDGEEMKEILKSARGIEKTDTDAATALAIFRKYKLLVLEQQLTESK